MARGNFWEVTYDPAWDGPSEVAYLTKLDGSNVLAARRVLAEGSEPTTVRWRRRDPIRTFQKCDFALHVRDSFISNCVFTLCRFKGSRWENVKFSNCRFDHCDFSESTLDRCHFVSDCAFNTISASAETFRIEETALSASNFIVALHTNLEHVGDKVDYQRYRLVGTKQKVAKALYSATRNESDVNYFFEAYEQLTRCTLEYGIQKHRYLGDGKRRNSFVFCLMSLPARCEKRIVVTSGWLTKWGRSVLRPTVFFLATVLLFAILYLDPSGLSSSWSRELARVFVQALNITLVAGYTAHFSAGAPLDTRIMMLTNVCVGLYWYSLIVPVLSRRVLR